jgi:Protein of unknown function (DUF3602)
MLSTEAPPEEMVRGRESGNGHSGRGGAGNTSRSGSRPPGAQLVPADEKPEDELRRQQEAKQHVHSSGRGGYGCDPEFP